MPEQCDPPVCARQRAGEADDAVERTEQCREQRVMVLQAAGQGLRMPAVTGKVEGDGDHAVARGGRREGLHQLLRAGEAVRDDDDRSLPGGRATGRPEHRDRDGIHVAAGDFESPAGGLEGAQRLAGQQQRSQRGERHPQGGWQPTHRGARPVRAARARCLRRPARTAP